MTTILVLLALATLVNMVLMGINKGSWTGVFFGICTVVYTMTTVLFWLWMR